MTRKKRRQRAPAVLLKPLGQIVTRAPQGTFAVSDRLARFLFPGLDREDVARVFPELTREVVRAADVWSRRQLMRNRLLTEGIRLYGYDQRIGALALPQPRLAALEPPAIISTFHVGVLPMLGFALEQLRAPVLVVRRQPGGAQHAAFERGATRGTEQERALLFHRCVSFLRTGRFVLLAADPFPAEKSALVTPFRGGTIRLARGPYALSRITGAPIIPLVARWRGASVEFVLGEPIAPAKDETAMAAEMAAWLDRYLTAAPLELSVQTLSLTR